MEFLESPCAGAVLDIVQDTGAELTTLPGPASFRTVNTPFNYTGNKHKLLPQLLPLFDRSKRGLVDLFCGGGAVYSNSTDLYDRVVANDIIGDLIGMHRGLIADKDGFVARTKALAVSKTDKAGYHRLRDAYNQAPTPEALYALCLSCNCNMMRFSRGLRFNQTFGQRTFNSNTELKINAWVAHMQTRVHKVTFFSKNFTEIWPDNPADTFFFCDPPYTNTEAGYNSFWSLALERALYDYLHRIDKAGGSFALCGVAGPHRNGKTSWLIEQLTAEGFGVVPLQNDFEVVAHIKGKRSQEVVIRNFSTP